MYATDFDTHSSECRKCGRMLHIFEEGGCCGVQHSCILGTGLMSLAEHGREHVPHVLLLGVPKLLIVGIPDTCVYNRYNFATLSNHLSLLECNNIIAWV